MVAKLSELGLDSFDEGCNPTREYLVLILKHARELRWEFDEGAGSVPLLAWKDADRLGLADKIRPTRQRRLNADQSSHPLEGELDLEFILGGQVVTFTALVSKSLSSSLIPWNYVVEKAPNSVRVQRKPNPELSIAGERYVLAGDQANIWRVECFTAEMVGAILGDTQEVSDDLDVEFPVEGCLEDDLEHIENIMKSIDSIVIEGVDYGCPKDLQVRLRKHLDMVAQGSAKLRNQPPPDRTHLKLNFSMTMDAGFTPRIEKRWEDRSPEEVEAKRAWEEKLLKTGKARIGEKEEVDFCSNIVTPLKRNFWAMNDKEANKRRPCGCFLFVNDHTLAEPVDAPKINDVKSQFNPHAIIKCISDAEKGFYSVRMDERAQRLAALHSTLYPGKCIIPISLMFGLKNAPFAFEKVISHALHGLPVLRIVDDTLMEGVPSVSKMNDLQLAIRSSWANVIDLFGDYGQRMIKHGLPVSLEKTKFGPEVKVLGGMRTLTGYEPDRRRVEALGQLPDPRNAGELRSMMHLLLFFAEYCPDLHLKLAPITKLTNSKLPWVWSTTEQKAWRESIQAVQEAILLTPFDWNRKTLVISDASNVGWSHWLIQIDEEGFLRVVAVKAKPWKGGEVSWSTVHKECAALVNAVKSSERYLQSVEFTMMTDHRPLLALLRNVLVNPSMWGGAALRYVTYLTQFNFSIRYIPGAENHLADIMSRYPFQRKKIGDGEARAPDWMVPTVVQEVKNLYDPQVQVRNIEAFLAKQRGDERLREIRAFVEAGRPASVQGLNVVRKAEVLSRLSRGVAILENGLMIRVTASNGRVLCQALVPDDVELKEELLKKNSRICSGQS